MGGRGGESVSAWMYVQYVPCGPPAPGAHLHWGVTNAHVRRRPSYAHRQWWVPGAGMAAACAGQGRWRAPRRGAPRAGAATRCGTGCGCPLATGNAHRPPPTPTGAARPQNRHPCAPLCPPPPPSLSPPSPSPPPPPQSGPRPPRQTHVKAVHVHEGAVHVKEDGREGAAGEADGRCCRHGGSAGGGGGDEGGGRGEESSDSDAQEESSDSDAHGGVGHDTARSRMGPLLAREGAWDGEGGGGWLREGNGEGEGGGATVTRRAARAPT